MYVHTHAITMKNESMDLKESKVGYMGGFGGKKGKRIFKLDN